VLKEVKALADALGERRDRDVHIAELDRISRSLSSADRAGVGELIRALRDEQDAANTVLAEALEEIERDDLRARLLALVEEARTA
jgi:CHAD domain-containing protein